MCLYCNDIIHVQCIVVLLLFCYITDMELNSSCEEEVDDVDSATPLNVINKIVGGKIPEKMDPSK